MLYLYKGLWVWKEPIVYAHISPCIFIYTYFAHLPGDTLVSRVLSSINILKSPESPSLVPILLPTAFAFTPHISSGVFLQKLKTTCSKESSFLPTCYPSFTKPVPFPLCSALVNSIHIHISKARNHQVIFKHFPPPPHASHQTLGALL